MVLFVILGTCIVSLRYVDHKSLRLRLADFPLVLTSGQNGSQRKGGGGAGTQGRMCGRRRMRGLTSRSSDLLLSLNELMQNQIWIDDLFCRRIGGLKRPRNNVVTPDTPNRLLFL